MKDTNNYEIGQSVFSFSTPLSLYLRQTYSDGILTNIDIQGFGTQTLLQTNMDLSPGCSGAPLFNNAGNVIGMITYKSTQFGVEGLGFAIPSNSLIKHIENLENGKEITNLGITFKNDIYQKYGIPGNHGLTIENIEADGTAHGKLFINDVVYKINGEPVTNIVTYYELLKNFSGEELTFFVKRNNKECQIKISGG